MDKVMEKKEEPKKVMFVATSNTQEKKKESIAKPAYKKESKRTVQSKKTPEVNLEHYRDAITLKLKNGVSLYVTKDADEDYTTILTLEDILALNKRKPNNIIGFSPAIYHEFVDRANATIRTYVKVGDAVKVKAKYLDKKGDMRRVVKDIYLTSLQDMTVVVATLSDGDFQVTNRLVKCE